MNYLPSKLTRLRKHYNYSQSYLAEVLGVDTLTYMGYENGRMIINYAQAKKLASFYHISVLEMFKNDDNIILKENSTNTDELNIEYFIPKQNIFQKIFGKIMRNKIATVGILLVIAIVGLTVAILSTNRKPYEPIRNNEDRISASETSVVYIDSLGSIKGNGDNSNGQLSSLPSSGIISVKEGGSFTVMLKEDGKIEAVGLPSKYAREISSWNNVVSLDAGNNHVVSSDVYGRVKCAGDNTYRQCEVSDFKNIKKVFAVKNGTVAINKEGIIYYTGEFYGSSTLKNYRNIKDIASSDSILVILNENGYIDYYAKNDIYHAVESWKNIVDVACGNDFIAGLDNNGKVFIEIDNVVIKKKVDAWDNIIAIDSGSDYLVGFDGNKVYGVGKNSYHQFDSSDSLRQTLPMIQNVKITADDKYLNIQFDPVNNASGYLVELNAGTGYSKIVSDYEVAHFESHVLIDGISYQISITSLGEGDYEDSKTFTVDYTYQPKKSVDFDNEEYFIVETLTGKYKSNFDAYLRGLGIPEKNIYPIESEDVCTSNEPVILEVVGISEGDKIMAKDMENIQVHYSYCKVNRDE